MISRANSDGELAGALESYLRAEPGGDTAQVTALEPMADGHAGLAYGFSVQHADGRTEEFVLKLAPKGVRRSGSTDVFRQAAPLRALHADGYPAPATPWASPEDAPLGAPFIVMRRLPGRTFIPWEPHPSFHQDVDRLARLWLDTAHAMGGLHRFDWRARLEGWEAPATLAGELERWSNLLRHTQDPIWLELAGDLLSGLRAATPVEGAVGLVHGDFQPGNVLFDGGRLSGVIDWDLTAIGPQGLDVGWLLMMGDGQGWAEDWRPVGPPPLPALVEAYAQAGGRQLQDLGWFQAFAHFRMAAIAGLNLKLHRDGRRRDDIWEKFALSMPALLRRGQSLL